MTKRKGIRLLAALALCFTLCISFTVPAFAYADDTEQDLPVTEATQPEATAETAAPEEPEPYEGEPIDGEGNAYTRDLLYDKATNKQFITVQTKTGNTFYAVSYTHLTGSRSPDRQISRPSTCAVNTVLSPMR